MLSSYHNFVETEVPEGELIVSRTDLNGNITYANEVFAKISGYTPDELLGKPHSIVRHPDMPCSVFKQLWETIRAGEHWRGYVKNLRKDGGYYWVYAEVSGVYKDNKVVEYKSLRSPIDDEKKIEFQDKYDLLREKEEGTCRIVANISVDNYEKLKKIAKEENIPEEKILNHFLSDTLF
jgi:aerotaxis receptor